MLAVTAQNPGSDGEWGTSDDLLAPINANPAHVSLDATPGGDCSDATDRVRNFIGGHPGIAIFAHADGSVLAITEEIDGQVFRVMGTMAEGETLTR